MYGTRDAPQIWSSEVRRVMEGMGFVACATNPCVFHHLDWDTIALAHVDDFLVMGGSMALEAVKAEITKEFEVKSKILGPGRDEYREVKFLGRILTWTEKGITYEADVKHPRRSSRSGTWESARRLTLQVVMLMLVSLRGDVDIAQWRRGRTGKLAVVVGKAVMAARMWIRRIVKEQSWREPAPQNSGEVPHG